MATIAAFVTAALLPGFAPTATGPGGGEILSGRLPGTVRDGLVYLPPGFGRANVRYPVVYLLHGLPGSPSEFTYGTDLLGFADTAIASGTVQPFIAIAPAAGLDHSYNGEWAGRWEQSLVDQIVPWADAKFPTLPGPSGRVLAGLSAGGFGAVNIALRHPSMFGTVESWSGYFTPLRDAPFTHASAGELARNNPTLTIGSRAATLRKTGTRFFLSTGPAHSHLIDPDQTMKFAYALHRLGIVTALRRYTSARGEWQTQLADGLTWALGLPAATQAA